MPLERAGSVALLAALFSFAAWAGGARAEVSGRPVSADATPVLLERVTGDYVDLAPPVSVLGADWEPLGAGELRWFGFRVYRAALWAGHPAAWVDDGDFALVIRYQRAIESSRLVQASLDEMRRLGLADEEQLSRWQPLLAQAFPDVAAGDRITGVNRAGRGAAFYFGERPTAQIDDPDFAQAFFAIWLDERTREPGLRARLTGQSGDG